MFSGMFGGLLGGNKTEPANATVATKTTTSSNSKVAATAGKPIGKTKLMTVKVKEEVVDDDGDPNDELYYQVKAQQRAQARKKRKH